MTWGAISGTWPTIPGYRLMGLIGEGAQGAVFIARSDAGEQHAVKVISSRPYSSDDRVAAAQPDDEVRARFLREATLLANLSHRNVVRYVTHGFTAGGDCPFLVMEFVEGHRLSRVSDAVAFGEAVIDVLNGLDHCHQLDVIHRDVKPHNVIVGPDGAVLVDFGLAFQGEPGPDRLSRATVGTPAYQPPEASHALLVPSPSQDLYAVGVMVHEMLTGFMPARDGRPVSLSGSAEPAAVFFGDFVNGCLGAGRAQFESADSARRSLQDALHLLERSLIAEGPIDAALSRLKRRLSAAKRPAEGAPDEERGEPDLGVAVTRLVRAVVLGAVSAAREMGGDDDGFLENWTDPDSPPSLNWPSSAAPLVEIVAMPVGSRVFRLGLSLGFNHPWTSEPLFISSAPGGVSLLGAANDAAFPTLILYSEIGRANYWLHFAARPLATRQGEAGNFQYLAELHPYFTGQLATCEAYASPDEIAAHLVDSFFDIVTSMGASS